MDHVVSQGSSDDSAYTSVSYSVKELFEEIKTSLEKLDTKLNNKASRDELQVLASELQHEVNELNTQLSTHRGRIDKLEAAREMEEKANNAVSEWKKWALPVVLSVVLVVLGVMQLYKTK